MGQGGAPEGVLAAAALKCLGGQIQGRLVFRNEDEKGRAASAGITDLDQIYTRDDMVRQDVIFAATGVTDGSILSGVKRRPGYVETEFAQTADLVGTNMVKGGGATAASVAKCGYDAMMAGKLVTINETMLSVLLQWIVPMMPRRMVLKMVEKMQSR